MRNGKYQVADIARYIINYSSDHERPVSNLKLQKVLYFIQAKFLVEAEYPCFEEDFEAWSFGPVIPSVYREYKVFGASSIPPIKKYFSISIDNIFDSKYKLFSYSDYASYDRSLIESMIQTCLNLSASELVEITHNQDPWLNAYIPHANRTIDKTSIVNYFKSKVG